MQACAQARANMCIICTDPPTHSFAHVSTECTYTRMRNTSPPLLSGCASSRHVPRLLRPSNGNAPTTRWRTRGRVHAYATTSGQESRPLDEGYDHPS
eukprot:15081231-Alexandrium_andersonii.AAC.1